MATTSGGYEGDVPAGPPPAPQAHHEGLVRDIGASLVARSLGRARTVWRASWFYRVLLSGPMPDRIVVTPEDLRPRRLEDADALLRGRFRLAGGLVTVRDQSPFDAPPPNETWAEELHGFGWLRHLAHAGGEAAADLIHRSVKDWVDRFANGHELAWRPHVTARRLTAWATYARPIFGTDLLWRSTMLRVMAQQARHLHRTAGEAPEGEPRLAAAIGLALSGLTLPDGAQRLARGQHLTAQELSRQILPDGGHVSRNPEALLSILLDLMTLSGALSQQSLTIPDAIQHAIDRMAPMLRFFRHGDGRLALFNGGGEGGEKAIEAALARDDAKGRPFGFAHHSGYQRMASGRTVVIVDTGRPPPPAFSAGAHAGTLAFEMSVGADRVIVNCGTTLVRGPEWREACRRTVAHSTLTLDDMSSAATLPEGLGQRLLGRRLAIDGAVSSQRKDEDGGILVQASHHGYERGFGYVHERRLFLDADGLCLSGEDMLLVPGRHRRPPRHARVAVRFHVHPDVRLSMAQDGQSVILALPAGGGWRFRAQGGLVAIEESVYLGTGETVRRTEQIVVSGEVTGEEARITWTLSAIAPD